MAMKDELDELKAELAKLKNEFRARPAQPGNLAPKPHTDYKVETVGDYLARKGSQPKG